MLSLLRLFEMTQPDVVFIKETTVCGIKSRKIYEKMLVDWDIFTVDSLIMSNDFLSECNSMKSNCIP